MFNSGAVAIYYCRIGGPEFWLFRLYDKNEISALTPKQRAALKALVKGEFEEEKGA
jgi:hypothetical protein